MQSFDLLASDPLRDARALENLTFDTPWSARAFGITLAAAEAGLFTLTEFQQALIDAIKDYERGGDCIDSDLVYYSRWIEALVGLLRSKQVLAEPQLMAFETQIREKLLSQVHAHDHDAPVAVAPLVVEGGR